MVPRLPGGQRRRIAVARALTAVGARTGSAGSRWLLVADEPAAHLDAGPADAVTTAVLAPVTDGGVVLVTHRRQDLGEVDRVVEIVDGRLVAAAFCASPRGAATKVS